jgi:anti-sigma factor RsiW
MEHRSGTKACGEFEAQLEDLLEGRAEGSDALSESNHLQECPACRQAFESASKISTFLRNALEPAKEPDPGFARRTIAAIRAEERALEEEKSFWRPLEVLAWRVALSAALAVALLVVYARSAPVVYSPQAQVMARETSEPELFNDPGRTPITGDDVFMLTTDTSHGK